MTVNPTPVTHDCFARAVHGELGSSRSAAARVRTSSRRRTAVDVIQWGRLPGTSFVRPSKPCRARRRGTFFTSNRACCDPLRQWVAVEGRVFNWVSVEMSNTTTGVLARLPIEGVDRCCCCLCQQIDGTLIHALRLANG
jgi:hypothetical protein